MVGRFDSLHCYENTLITGEESYLCFLLIPLSEMLRYLRDSLLLALKSGQYFLSAHSRRVVVKLPFNCLTTLAPKSKNSL